MAVPLPGAELLPPQQQTLFTEASFAGIGLHTGRRSQVTVAPSDPDHGLVFHSQGVSIPALAEFVGDTRRCSTLSRDGVAIHTVEHLLAALYALGIDNADIYVDGIEPPAMDGSALPFAQGLLNAGIKAQDALPQKLWISEPVWIKDGDRQVVAFPAPTGWGLTVAALVDFHRPYAGPQNFCYSLEGPHRSWEAMRRGGSGWGVLDGEIPSLGQPAAEGGTPLSVFLDELAPARTFCFEDWIASILAAGLGSGGSLENTLVLGENGPSTPLRFANELARHKTLDLLGDLALVGGRLEASVIAIEAGHSLHTAAARRIRRVAHDAKHSGDRRAFATPLPLSPD